LYPDQTKIAEGSAQCFATFIQQGDTAIFSQETACHCRADDTATHDEEV
jgi:hypothetical protein